jgi:hypothetical protein
MGQGHVDVVRPGRHDGVGRRRRIAKLLGECGGPVVCGDGDRPQGDCMRPQALAIRIVSPILASPLRSGSGGSKGGPEPILGWPGHSRLMRIEYSAFGRAALSTGTSRLGTLRRLFLYYHVDSRAPE